ncbi:MAG: protoporphyrinogen oxidase [Planctomycetia bacterium]|nr:protoporphyrinogen oxidase [Planctomycetia bacterium]
MNNPRLQHVVVIGGGMAGLAAAEALLNEPPKDAGAGHDGTRRVTLIEPSGRVGGVMETVRRDGWLIERSADSFLAARPEAVALVERAGLAGELIGVDPRVRRALILRHGRTQAVPLGFRLIAPGILKSILTTPLLSPLGRLRLLCERFVPVRDRSLTDESLEQFAVRRLGREAFEQLVQPLAAGIWTADPARLSMAAACPEFFAMEIRDGSLWAGEQKRGRAAAGAPQAVGARYGQFLTLASGMETLPRRLADQLAARGVQFITASATGVRQRPDHGWDVSLRKLGVDADAAATSLPTTIEADAVIVAVPSGAAAELLRSADPTLATALAAIEYAGSAVVSLGFAREDVTHPLDAAGVVIPRREGRRILAVSFSSQKFPGRAPEGSVLMRTFVGGALDPETAALDDGRLLPLVLAELRDVLGVRGTPRLVQIDRWRGAMPQYTVGHADRVATIQQLVASHRGLALAGAAYEGVGIPQVIASGQAAAASLRPT